MAQDLQALFTDTAPPALDSAFAIRSAQAEIPAFPSTSDLAGASFEQLQADATRILQMRPKRRFDVWKLDDCVDDYPLEILAIRGVIKGNQTTGQIWEMCSGTSSIEEIIHHFCHLCPDVSPEVIAADVIQLLWDFSQRKLLILNYDALGALAQEVEPL